MSATLSFGLYELASNPKVQNRLRYEIKANVENEQISYERLHSMQFLDKVVLEILRKYLLAMMLDRKKNQDFTFDSTGLQIDKGTPILIPVTSLHCDPQYFPNPEAFDPERFTEEKKKELQYVYLPFGDGPRKCIGEWFTLLSVKVALKTIIKDFLPAQDKKMLI